MLRGGSVGDLPVIAVVLFALAVGVVLASTVLTEVQDATSRDELTDSLNKAEAAIGLFDGLVVFAGGAMYMVSLILAFRIPTSPIFFIPSLILGSISLWISAEFANLFYKLINVGGPVTSAANNFPTIVTLFENFALIQGGVLLLLMVVMFTRIGETRRAVR